MTFPSVLEIYSNPADLQIFVGEDAETKEWGFAITRGPGHNFKPILSSQPFAKTLAEVVDGVRTLLQNVCIMVEKETFPGDPSTCLTPELINRIGEDLLRNKVANTFEMPGTRVPA